MEDVLGKSDFDTYSPELAAKFWADDKFVLDSGIPIISREEPGLDSQGNPIWVSTTKVPLRDGNGQITGLVGIGRDITERKQTQEMLAKRAQQLATVADVSAAVSANLEQGQLLQSVVDLVKERFDFYHAHVYLLNDAGDTLLLAAGAGEVGRQMMLQGRQISFHHEHSLVARTAASAEASLSMTFDKSQTFCRIPYCRILVLRWQCRSSSVTPCLGCWMCRRTMSIALQKKTCVS